MSLLEDHLVKRLRLVPLAFSMAVAVTASVAAASTPDAAATLIGTWSCQSLAHTVSTMTYERTSDGMSMHNAYQTATGAQGSFDETYRYDRDTDYWAWATTESITGTTENGTARPWISKTWTFDGARRISEKRSETIQMVYTRLSDDSFRREFRVNRDGTWRTTSSSVCKRQR